MSILQLQSKAEVDKFIDTQNGAAVLYHSPNSPASDQTKEFLTNIAKEFDTIKFGIVHAEEVPEASLAHKIVAVPTVLFFISKVEKIRINGYKPVDIREAANQFSSTDKQPLEKRLQDLVTSKKLMLFMKGKPEQPQCGFSRRIVDLLNGINAEYGSFDILSDNEVREGLKKFSNWPTYPQLYLNGELIGGLDVVAEELNDPDFVATLPQK